MHARAHAREHVKTQEKTSFLALCTTPLLSLRLLPMVTEAHLYVGMNHRNLCGLKDDAHDLN